MTLDATEKFGVLYTTVPAELHVDPSDDEAYSIPGPLYQNAQWRLAPESKKLLRAPDVVELVEVEALTTETCACATLDATSAMRETTHKNRGRNLRGSWTVMPRISA